MSLLKSGAAPKVKLIGAYTLFLMYRMWKQTGDGNKAKEN